MDELKRDLQDISDLVARMEERQIAMADKLEAILSQAIKTNGRLTKAEYDIIELRLHNAESKGQWKGIALFSAAVGAIITWVINLIR